MKVGDRVVRHPITFYEFPPDYDRAEKMIGTVVYIHPKNRFHVVEFIINGKKVRESFNEFQLVKGDTGFDPNRCWLKDHQLRTYTYG